MQFWNPVGGDDGSKADGPGSRAGVERSSVQFFPIVKLAPLGLALISRCVSLRSKAKVERI